ncbi:universal stress protein [Halobacterium zhouii]|uniref:universal stress protein n=1 Tax=Halobacterium zhouii TaxID=2902624 RepID=UPI001E40C720|nr:universal stress protein [Halobacterium zhouii]
MNRVVVPVRYPLTEHSKATLQRAVEVADERDADLTVLHVALYQEDTPTTRTQLKRAVERAFGHLSRARYVVRKGFLVEETILDEVAAEDADVVVIGGKQAGRWRRALRRIFDEPDVEGYLKRELDCEVVVVRS